MSATTTEDVVIANTDIDAVMNAVHPGMGVRFGPAPISGAIRVWFRVDDQLSL